MSFEILFPIADHVMNPIWILTIGLMGGVIAGMLGISSGVIVTPLLVVLGIHPMTAVASQLHNAIGTNLMGFMGYWRQRDIDFAFAWYLFLGGMIGAFGEIFLLEAVAKNISAAQKLTITYLVVLGSLGVLMMYQNVKQIYSPPKTSTRSVTMRRWMIYCPFHRIFTRARIEMSILIPILVGIATGLLTSTLGGGNSVFMMPIVYYLIGRTSPVVAGTTIFAAFFISLTVMFIHGFSQSHSDWILALILLIGSAIGSQLGLNICYAIKRQHLGIIAATVLLSICAKFGYDFHTSGVKTSAYALTKVRTLEAALLTTPDWALWMVKLAYEHPIFYSTMGIVWVIALSFLLEFLTSRYMKR